MHGETLKFMKP